MGTKQLLETNTQCLDGRLQGVAFFSSNIFVFRNFHFKGREGEEQQREGGRKGWALARESSVSTTFSPGRQAEH